ncbi:MAG: hypothetical protein LBI03_06750 [Clostridiales bacterium]|jgi:hypothetical protein|nr:hypothetical protein [Clostridiales bacterium]
MKGEELLVIHSVLIQSMLQMTDELAPGGDPTILFTMLLAYISAGGSIFTIYTLLGKKKKKLSIFLLGIPFGVIVLIAFIGFIPSFWTTPSNYDLLNRTGITQLFSRSRLYEETLILLAVFAVVCVMYIVLSQRMRTRNRTMRTWIIAVAFSCGIETLLALALLVVSLARLAGIAIPLEQSLAGRLYFVAAAMILLKIFEQVFTLFYVELFGAKRFVPILNKMSAYKLEQADFSTLKKLIRKQCGILPLPLFVFLLVVVISWGNLYTVKFGPWGALFVALDNGITLILPFLLPLLGILAMRAVCFFYPSAHPLARYVLKIYDNPDRTAKQLLSEYSNPLFTAGNVLVTQNFLIRESTVLRVYSLSSLAEIKSVPGSFRYGLRGRHCLLLFSDGKKLSVEMDQMRLINYAKSKLAQNTDHTMENRRHPVKNVVSSFTWPLMSVLMIALIIISIWFIGVSHPDDYSELKNNLGRYNEAAQTVISDVAGESDGTYGITPLPAGYAGLSQGGMVCYEVSATGVNVFFYKDLGLLGGYEGFFYMSGGVPESGHLSFAGGNITYVVNLNEGNWCYAGAK